MSETNVALVHRWFDEVWNQKKESTIDELLSPEAKGTGLGDDGTIDFESFKGFWHTLLETFPDLHVEIEECVSQGDQVAVHIVCTGTHQGHGLGIQPSGGKVRFDAQAITTWKNGQIIRGRNVVDLSPVFKASAQA